MGTDGGSPDPPPGDSTTDTPPIGGSWRRVYLLLTISLAVEIALLYLLGRLWS